MTEVLVLGATGWVGARVARAWAQAGARVVGTGRGGRVAPRGVELAILDRALPDAYARLRERTWDAIVDVSSDPAHVAAAVAALGSRTRHWTYVSSVSVYADDVTVGLDERAPVVSVPADTTDLDYAQAKVACERAARAAETTVAIVRPGLIVGDADTSDRFGYWPGRFALAGAGEVLTPDAAGRGIQTIDVDDLAAFIVELGAAGVALTANAVGPTAPLQEVLERAADVAGFTGRVLVGSDEFLAQRDVQFWAGTRSLPLWLPRRAPGFSTRRGELYLAAGGRHRSLERSLVAALRTERALGLTRSRRAGLERGEELGLLAALAADLPGRPPGR